MSHDLTSIVINDNSIIIGDNARVDTITTRTTDSTTTPSAQLRGRSIAPVLVISTSTRAEFPWLGLDDKGRHYCVLCKKHGADPTKKEVRAANNWIDPKPPTPIRYYRDHATAHCHIAAVRYEETAKKNPLQTGLKTAQEKSFANLRNHFIVAHTLAVTHSATFQYATWMRVLADDIHIPMMSEYKGHSSARLMQLSMGNALQIATRDAVLQSGFPFGILIDESTDLATKKSLIIYIKYIDINTFHPVISFLALLAVPDSTAEGITRTVLNYLKERKYPLSRMTGFGSDGASVMTGWKDGVAVRIQRDNSCCSCMVCNHCSSHKTSLSAGDAVDSAKDITNHFDLFQLTISKIGTFYHKSPSRLELLYTKEEQFNEKKLKTIKHLKVRWLSLHTVSERIVKIYNSIRSSINELSMEKSKNQDSVITLRNNISTFSFIVTAYFITDILYPIVYLSKKTQEKNLSISNLSSTVETTLELLIPFENGKFGASLTSLFNDAQDAVDLSGEIKTATFIPKVHEIALPVTVSQNDINFHKELFIRFARALSSAVRTRFPDNPLLNAMRIFDFTKWPKPTTEANLETLSTYGDDDIKIIVNHFKKSQLIDEKSIQFEWFQARKLIIDYLKKDRKDLYDVWKIMYDENSQTIPNIFTLAAISFTMPMSSAECERGFSRQNITKTKLRNRLLHRMLDALLRISINAPCWSNMNEADVFTQWKQRNSDQFNNHLAGLTEKEIEDGMEPDDENDSESFDWNEIEKLYDKTSEETIIKESIIKKLNAKRKRQREAEEDEKNFAESVEEVDAMETEEVTEIVPSTQPQHPVTISRVSGRQIKKSSKLTDYLHVANKKN